MRRWTGLMGLLLTLAAAPAEAQFVPLGQMFRPKIEADPHKDYDLTDREGPFMIMAATFSGEVAEDQARELTLELRARFQLEAYVFRKTFDLNDRIPTGKLTPDGQAGMARYRRGGRPTEWAVLVGNFSNVDAASETLKQVKQLQPRCMTLSEDKPDARNLGALRYMQSLMQQSGDSPDPKSIRGPLSYSFVTLNPLKPKNAVVSRGLTPEIVALNRPLEYSLLKSPGRYSVKVATFTGRVITDPNEVARLEGKEVTDSQLARGERLAHDLTKELRKRGYEAYEFHDRYASMVFVGSFDDLGPKIEGEIQLRDDIVRIMENFGAHKQTDPNGQPNAKVGQPKQVTVGPNQVPIALDIQPLIVEIPRESVGAAYNQRW